MPARTLLPDDDLYARLEVPVDASYETIEIAWRALLRRHHPDVAGDEGLAQAKAINVAHDWLSSPDLRARYDREHGIRTAASSAASASPTATAAGQRPRPAARRRPADPRAALERFIDRVGRLTADELDRLDCAEPAPIAFVATIERFLSEADLAAVAAAEAAVIARLPVASRARPAVRDAVLGYASELVLGEFLDAHLDEPFRSRVRERLTRGWDAAIGQPRYGPAGQDVETLIRRVEALDPEELRRLAATGSPPDLGDAPWPPGTTREDDEALRVSSELAGRDVAAVIDGGALDAAGTSAAGTAAARVAHLLVLRHAFPTAEWERLTKPWRPWLIPRPRPPAASVRRRG
jgi:curved DNA-binding protein CbpA